MADVHVVTGRIIAVQEERLRLTLGKTAESSTVINHGERTFLCLSDTLIAQFR